MPFTLEITDDQALSIVAQMGIMLKAKPVVAESTTEPNIEHFDYYNDLLRFVTEIIPLDGRFTRRQWENNLVAKGQPSDYNSITSALKYARNEKLIEMTIRSHYKRLK